MLQSHWLSESCKWILTQNAKSALTVCWKLIKQHILFRQLQRFPLYFLWDVRSDTELLSTVYTVIHCCIWQYVCQVMMVNTKAEENIKKNLIVICNSTGELIRIKADKSHTFPLENESFFSVFSRHWLIISWGFWRSIHKKKEAPFRRLYRGD